MIKDQLGKWQHEEREIKKHAMEFFSKLYTEDNEEHLPYLVNATYPEIETSLIKAIGQDVDNIEIKNIIFSMPPMKALGIDGLHAIFFQSHWDLVDPSVCKLVK